MTVYELLELVDKNPFLLFYYAFSMLLSVLLGRFFLVKMGHPKVWNYFFALLFYVMSVFGLFSIIVFMYDLLTRHLTLSAFEMLIPLGTLILSILIIYKRVDIVLITGFQNLKVFLSTLFLILLICFAADYFGLIPFSDWPIYLFFLFLIAVVIAIRFLIFRIKSAQQV